MTRFGTSYFVSHAAAVSYYAEQHEPASAVDRKIAAGEIHIGKPPLAEGQRLLIIDGGRRYAVEL